MTGSTNQTFNYSTFIRNKKPYKKMKMFHLGVPDREDVGSGLMRTSHRNPQSNFATLEFIIYHSYILDTHMEVSLTRDILDTHMGVHNLWVSASSIHI